LPSDTEVVAALVAVLSQDAFNHEHLQPLDGRLANGMSVMAMAAHTGCNTVFGSTPPNNPHPYPWMNSLFQDGSTIGWLMGESFILDHARSSVLPERLCDALLQRDSGVIDEAQLFDYLHFSDTQMTDREIHELPKVWVVGGDGGMGDIGYQNVSKVVLQNRPNVKLLMLDTQVYSNTGGQNSDSSLMPGGADMNSLGAATQGKMTEKKSVSESFTSGHGSPYVAQVSMANAAKLYKAMLDALEYRGTAFLQCYTSCQPEHGIGDDLSTVEAQRARDSRVMPEFTFHPGRGETRAEAFDLKGNPTVDRDFWEATFDNGEKYAVTPAHFAVHEQRFRRHRKDIKLEEAGKHQALATCSRASRRTTSRIAATSTGPPRVRSGLRRLHPLRSRGQVARLPAVAAARAVLHRTAQGLAHAAERRRHRQPRLQGTACGDREGRQGRGVARGLPRRQCGDGRGRARASARREEESRAGSSEAGVLRQRALRRKSCAGVPARGSPVSATAYRASMLGAFLLGASGAAPRWVRLPRSRGGSPDYHLERMTGTIACFAGDTP
jgi:pyruvate/2-oxoacid:ferredoxin oxidoreductase beta subunit